MKKAIYTYRNDIGLDKLHEYMKLIGFDSMMMWWGDDRKEYIALSKKYDLEICDAHLPFDDIRKLWIPNNTDGDNYANWLCEQIKECGQYKIPKVVMHLSKGYDALPSNDVGLNRLQKIVEIAEHHNVKIAFENLRMLEYLDYIFDTIKSKNIGFCFDSGHQNCFTPQRYILDDYKDKLISLHIADNDGIGDLHILPYDGTADFNRFAKVLAEIDYNGTLSLEVQQDRYPLYEKLHPQEFLELAFDKLKAFENTVLRYKQVI